jgi:hypothetical protein
MRKLLWLAVVMFAVQAWGLDQFSGWCENGNNKVSVQGALSSTLVQKSYPNTSTPSTSCKITVYDHGTTNVSTIYSDNLATPTPLANPFYVNTNGSYQLFADNGRYDIVGIAGVVQIFSVSDVLFLDPLEASTFSNISVTDAFSFTNISTTDYTNNVRFEQGLNPASNSSASQFGITNETFTLTANSKTFSGGMYSIYGSTNHFGSGNHTGAACTGWLESASTMAQLPSCFV